MYSNPPTRNYLEFALSSHTVGALPFLHPRLELSFFLPSFSQGKLDQAHAVPFQMCRMLELSGWMELLEELNEGGVPVPSFRWCSIPHPRWECSRE